MAKGAGSKQGGLGLVSFVTGVLVAALVVSGVDGSAVLFGIMVFAGVMLLIAAWTVLQFLRGSGPHAPAAVPHGPQPCPRCGDGARGPSGWCWPCFGVLQQSPMTAGHPLWTAETVADLSPPNLERTVAVYAPTFTMHGWTGEPVEMSHQSWRRTLKLARRAFPDYRVEVEAAFVDPADPAIAWTRGHERGRRRFGGPPLDSRTVTRFRLEDGLVAEFWVAAPMPVA